MDFLEAGKSRFLEVGKSRFLGPGNPEVWSPKNKKNQKFSKFKSVLPKMLARSGLVGKKSSRPHLGPSEAIFSMDRKNPKNAKKKCIFSLVERCQVTVSKTGTECQITLSATVAASAHL